MTNRLARANTLSLSIGLAVALAVPGCINDDDGPDRSLQQSAAGSCTARCGGYQEDESCQCDPECTEWGDCCDDYAAQCVGCVYGGVRRPVGVTFPSGDGCNTCMCTAPGVVGCTDKACDVCEYSGAFYLPGESFLAADGCVVCTCTDGGDLECTSLPCGQ